MNAADSSELARGDVALEREAQHKAIMGLESGPRRFQGDSKLGAVLRSHVLQLDVRLWRRDDDLQRPRHGAVCGSGGIQDATGACSSNERTQWSTATVLEQRRSARGIVLGVANEHRDPRCLHAVGDDIRVKSAIEQLLRGRRDDTVLELDECVRVLAGAGPRQHEIIGELLDVEVCQVDQLAVVQVVLRIALAKPHDQRVTVHATKHSIFAVFRVR